MVRNGDAGRDDSFSRQTRVIPLVDNRIPSRQLFKPFVPEAIASWFRQAHAPDSVHIVRTMYEYYSRYLHVGHVFPFSCNWAQAHPC